MITLITELTWCRLPEDWHLHSNERAVKSTLKRIAEIQNQLDGYNLCAQVPLRLLPILMLLLAAFHTSIHILVVLVPA